MTDLYPTNCDVCGASLKGDAGRCTNGRCSTCHRKHCTEGGETSPGHGRGTVLAIAFERAIAKKGEVR